MKWQLSRSEAEFLCGAVKKAGPAAQLIRSLQRKGLLGKRCIRPTVMGAIIIEGIFALREKGK